MMKIKKNDRSCIVGTFFVLFFILIGGCGGAGNEKKDDGKPTEKFILPEDIEKEEISGTGYSAFILIDKNGLPHIKADDMENGLFALGYFMARMRYAQMDMLRVVANGLVSSIVDLPEAREFDSMTVKTLIHLETGKLVPEVQWEMLKEKAPSEARLFDAFIQGINLFIDRLGEGKEVLPPEYKTLLAVRKPSQENKEKFYFTAPQILAMARFQSWYLTGQKDITFERIISKMREKVEKDIWRRYFSELITARAGVNIFTLPSPQFSLEKSGMSEELRKFLAFMNLSPFYSSKSAGFSPGSNNWVISPSVSEEGTPMVANDPHLPLFNPPLWFPWQGEMGDNFYEGFALSGIPGILSGTNGKVAWGVTNAGFDSLDMWMENIREDEKCTSGFSAVHNPSDEKDDMCVMHTKVKIGSKSKPEISIFYCMKHGVILGRKDEVLEGNIPGELELSPGEYISFRWNGHQASLEPLFFFKIINSQSVDEFMENIKGFEVAPINFVFADLDGNIGYGTFALLPQRNWNLYKFPPIEILPSDGCCDWENWVPKDKFPYVKNPPKGFIATANNDLPGYTEDGDPFNDPIYLFWSYDPGYRVAEITHVIQEKIDEKGKVSLEDMKLFLRNTVSYWTRGVLPWVVEELGKNDGRMSDTERKSLELLRSWDMTCLSGFKLDNLKELSFSEVDSQDVRKDSSACTIFWVLTNRLIINTFSDEISLAGESISGVFEDYFLKQIYYYATGTQRKTFFDDVKTQDRDESASEILYRSFSEAVKYLSDEFGEEPESWLWGKIAKMKLYHFASQVGFGAFDIGPFPIDLGPVAPAVAWVSLTSQDPKKGFIMTGGPSMRVVYLPRGEKFRAVFAFPGGVAGFGKNGLTKPDPDSFFTNLLPTYFGDEFISFSDLTQPENFIKAIQIIR